ncbi:MAG: GntR family transcriptional regulator [Anaerolineae bacterium]
MAQLNRQSFEPLYYQVAEILRGAIESGELPVGTRVPSERELMQQYEISRNTARRALDTLAREGLIYFLQGRGTFVAPTKMRQGLARLSGFSEDMIRAGLKPSSRLLKMQLISPSPKVARHLALRPDQQVIHIERLRLADGQPMALNTSYVPYHLCPQLLQEDLGNDSLFRLLEEKYGLYLWRSEQVLRPAVATEYEAELLGVALYTPLLLAEGTTYLKEDIPIEYMTLLYRGDRYEFVIHMTRDAPTQVRREVGK